jgi:hypothetical protein
MRIECYSNPPITKEDIEFGKKFEERVHEQNKIEIPEPKEIPQNELPKIRFY